MKKIAIFLFITFYVQTILNAQFLIPYRLKDKWGYCDTLGKIKITPHYTNVSLFNHYTKKGMVYKKELYTIINEKGVEQYDFFSTIDELQKPFAIVHLNQKKGVVNGHKLIVPIIYDTLYSTDRTSEYANKKNCLIGIKGKQYFLVNYIKNETIAIKSPSSNEGIIWNAEEKSYTNEEDEKIKLLPILNQTKVEQKLDSINYYLKYSKIINNQFVNLFLYKTYLNNKIGLVEFADPGSNISFPKFEPKYEEIKGFTYNFLYNYLKVKLNGKYGVLQNFNTTIVPFEYDNINDLTTIFAIVEQQGKNGCIIFNTIYKPIPCKYDSINFAYTLEIKNNWHFLLFEIINHNKKGFIGENGIEYFKD